MDISALQQMIQLQAMSQLNANSTGNTSTTDSGAESFSNLLNDSLATQSSDPKLNQSLGLVNGLTTPSANAGTSALSNLTNDATNTSETLSTIFSLLSQLTSNSLGSAVNANALTTSLPTSVYNNYRNTYAQNAVQTNTIAPTTATSAGQKTAYDDIIKKASDTYGIPEKMIKAVIKQESGFDTNATSGVGAAGLMQLMPATATSLGVTDSYDAEQNIMAGTKYLKQMLNQFGDYKTMVAAYNAGPGNVSKYGGIPPFTETQNYVNKVMTTFNA
ncbi:MAG: lytic transglycosylase domain-containing protein [Kurthia sp.]|nr:lytic transglycosylase domain-containing protein [Candidatus Kurthia equi]